MDNLPNNKNDDLLPNAKVTGSAVFRKVPAELIGQLKKEAKKLAKEKKLFVQIIEK